MFVHYIKSLNIVSIVHVYSSFLQETTTLTLQPTPPHTHIHTSPVALSTTYLSKAIFSGILYFIPHVLQGFMCLMGLGETFFCYVCALSRNPYLHYIAIIHSTQYALIVMLYLRWYTIKVSTNANMINTYQIFNVVYVICNKVMQLLLFIFEYFTKQHVYIDQIFGYTSMQRCQRHCLQNDVNNYTM